MTQVKAIFSTDDDIFSAPRNDALPLVTEHFLPADPLAVVVYWQKTNMLETVTGAYQSQHSICRALECGTPSVDYSLINTDKLKSEGGYRPDTESVETARRIRDYYQVRLAYRAFMNEQSSKFDQNLHDFLKQPIGKFNSNHLGVIVNLPGMYETDIKYDSIKVGRESLPQQDNQWWSLPTQVDATLKYVDKLPHRRARRNYSIYYFEDAQNRLYKIKTEKNEYLRPFLEHFCNRGTMKISGYLTIEPLHPNSDFLVYNVVGDFEVL